MTPENLLLWQNQRRNNIPVTVIFLSFLFTLASTTRSSALDVPPLRGRVNDLAAMLPSDGAQLLEDRLATFERETGHQIAVLTIPSLEGDVLEDFSIRVAESWKIGKKGFDNGVILVIAQNDRKLRIEVGYGLEGVLPDAIASRIIREVIVPRFRNNDFGGGIEAGVEAIMKSTRGEALPSRAKVEKRIDRQLVLEAIIGVSIFTFVSCLFLTLLSAELFAAQARSTTQRRFFGGLIGGVTAAGTAALFERLDSQIELWLWAWMLVPGVIIGALVWQEAWKVSGREHGGIDWGGEVSFGGGGGSSSGGGGGGFGGDGGGGFSGGGGGFGGGGASGSW